MRKSPLPLTLFMICGCSFSPNLGERGYVPCESETDCGTQCECVSHWCLPPRSELPSVCEPNSFVNKTPFRFSVSTTGSNPVVSERTIVVDSVLDNEAPDEFTTLREALTVAREKSKTLDRTGQPVRIAFDSQVFNGQVETLIKLTSPLPPLAGEKVFLDARGANVVLVPHPSFQSGPGLTVACSDCLVAGLKIRNFSGWGVAVVGAQGAYLMALEIRSNAGGVQIEGNSADVAFVVPPAGASPFGANSVVANNDGNGLEINGAKEITVVGVNLIENSGNGIVVNDGSRDVSIGVPIKWNGWMSGGNLFAGNSYAIQMQKGLGTVLIRGNVFVGQLYAPLDFEGADATVLFYHNTAVDPQIADVKCHGVNAVTFIGKNNIFRNAQNRSLWWTADLGCPRPGSEVDCLLFQQVDCDPNLPVCQWVSDPNANKKNEDPQLNPDYVPGPRSGAIDSGCPVSVDGVALDVNGVGAGLFNGLGPDLGAIETAP